MSLNTTWDRKYLPKSSSVRAQSPASTDLPVQVNTPQSSPASWPQLGAKEQLPTVQMSNAPINQTEGQSGWGSIPPGMNTNSDYDGTGAWGRLPDIKSTASPSHQVSGWGETPSTTSSWGQSQPNVDDGTAVWDKSTVSHKSQGNWGGGDSVSKTGDTPGGAWGGNSSNATLPNPEPSNPQIQKPPVTKTTTTSNPIPNQPVSWAKAASTGLPTSENSGASEPAHDEAQPENIEVPSQPTPPIDNDPMHQLVNSHDGWGKKPIQQSTSWNVSSEPVTNPGRPINNGTEAWGKASSGQLPPAAPGWNKSPTEPNNWGAAGASANANANAYTNQTPAGNNWRAPPQQQQMPPQAHSGFMGNAGGGNGGGGGGGWGDGQMMSGNSHNGRWGEVPMQRGNSNPQTGNWNRDMNLSSNWSNGSQPRAGQGGPSWNNNMMPQSGNMDNSWGPGRMMEGGNNARRPSTVDNGTAAWGDPTTYNKVNLWEKSGKPGLDMPNAGGSANGEQKSWGLPQNQPSASPKGWGDLSPTTPSSNDKGASGWGQKQLASNEKGWDNKEGNNWNSGPGKINTGSNYTNDWGAQQDPSSGWESQGHKNDMMMKNNLDYGRGKLSQQSNLGPQNMVRGVPPAVPPQLQAQLQQIQNAAASGIIPSQVLNPHLMTPQHMHALVQLVNKATELRNIQMQFNLLSQNKNISPMIRHQQLEHFSRSIRQTQQQIEVLRGAIMQNVLQNSQNLSKPNMPGSGMDLRPGQAMMSPLNTVGSLGQALPNLPNSPMSNPGNREMKSRFINNWNRNKINGIGDVGMPLEGIPNSGFMPGPGGDFEFNDNSPFDPTPNNYLDNLKMQFPDGLMQRGGNMPGEQAINPIESATGLTDIGPPEFTPGVPWKGFRHIDPEEDHDITPGSVAIAKTMSINTVRDADQVLKRERSSHSDSSTGIHSGIEKNISQPSVNANSEINAYQWSTGANGANPAPKMTPSMLSHELWKVPLSSGQSNYQSSPSYQQNKKLGPSWEQSSQSLEPQQQRMLQQQGGWGAPDARGSWLVLTNVNAQVNIASLEQLCMQQGVMHSFRSSFPIEGMALVKYATSNDAENAKKALNMYMAGTTMIVATVATDQEVNNFVTAGNNGSKSLSWQSGGNNSNRLSSMGSTGGFVSQPPLGASNEASWGSNKASAGWAGNPAWSRGAGEEGSRIMSPMDSLLPVNLLGGETM